MERFHIIDDGVAILRIRGKVWRQTKIYHREGRIYAAYGGGFIQLMKYSGTSDPGVSCQGVEGPGVSIVNNLPIYTQPKKKAAPRLVAGAS